MYYFRLSPSKRPKYGAYRILLSSSFLFSHFHCFLVYILPYDISILSTGAQVKDTPIHHPTSSSPCSIRFSTFFHHPFWSIKKRLMPTCIRFCSSLPCHFCTWTTISSLFLFSRSLFFAPDEHNMGNARSMPLIFMFRSSSVSRCTLFGIYSSPSRH